MKYFRHSSDSFNDEKIMKIFITVGYEGLGMFYTALEILAKMESPVEEAIIKKMLFINKKTEKIWELIKNVGLISKKNGEIFSEKLMEYAGKYEIKKEKNKTRVDKFRSKNIKKSTKSKSVTHYTSITDALQGALHDDHVTPSNKEEGIKKEKIKKENVSGRAKAPTIKISEKEEKGIVWVIEFLNKSTGKKFSPESQKSREYILARMREGRTGKEFEKVIKIKSQQWLGTENEKYLRPETLFNSTKFEGYVNESFSETVKKTGAYSQEPAN